MNVTESGITTEVRAVSPKAPSGQIPVFCAHMKHESQNTRYRRKKGSGRLTVPIFVTELGMLTDLRDVHW